MGNDEGEGFEKRKVGDIPLKLATPGPIIN